MKIVILIITCLLTAGDVTAQTPNKNYDSALAKKLKANDNGMKQYYLVILKTGTSGISDKTILDSLFRGHMKNIQKLASENNLVVAGPIGKNDKTYRGIFVLNTSSREEAEKMVQTDPAVQAKIFDAEYYPWFASAALQETLSIHNKLQKNN
jgi:uncharacterized protein YciI